MAENGDRSPISFRPVTPASYQRGRDFVFRIDGVVLGHSK
jgi:hypothetical protein